MAAEQAAVVEFATALIRVKNINQKLLNGNIVSNQKNKCSQWTFNGAVETRLLFAEMMESRRCRSIYFYNISARLRRLSDIICLPSCLTGADAAADIWRSRVMYDAV